MALQAVVHLWSQVSSLIWLEGCFFIHLYTPRICDVSYWCLLGYEMRITSTRPLNVRARALLRNVLTTTCSAAHPPISCRSTQHVDDCLEQLRFYSGDFLPGDGVRAGWMSLGRQGFGLMTSKQMFYNFAWIKTKTVISFSMISMI